MSGYSLPSTIMEGRKRGMLFSMANPVFSRLHQRLVGQKQDDDRRSPNTDRAGPDIRAESQQPAARLQTSHGLPKSSPAFFSPVLEEITREHGVEEVVGKGPARGAILLQQDYVSRGMVRRGGIQIHPILPGANDVIDELAISAAEVQNLVIRADPTREEIRGEDAPDTISIVQITPEPAMVDFLQILG